MASIESVTLEVADPTAADRLLHRRLSQPATVSGLIGAALDVGATPRPGTSAASSGSPTVSRRTAT